MTKILQTPQERFANVPGFPYRAVLWLPEQSCYLGELGAEEEARISQRRKALLKLREHLFTVAAQPSHPLS